MTLINRSISYANPNELLLGFLEGFLPPPKLTVAEWADRYRYLSPESSAEAGKYRATAYQRGVMEAYSDSSVSSLVLMWSSQVGKTEIINNIVGYHIDIDPCPILLLQPTLEMAESWSKDRLSPMLRDTPRLAGKVESARARDAGNTLRHKTFMGGHITAAGANSPASLASRPIRLSLMDEIDRYPVSAGAEGDPTRLAERRTATFWNRKSVLISSPTVKGLSKIEARYQDSDRRQWLVPCPDCGVPHPLAWGNVQWEKDDQKEGLPATAVYCCPECGSVWDDAKRWNASESGQWVATAPFAGTAGFHLNALASPFVVLAELVKEFLSVRHEPDGLRQFVNTVLAESWEETNTAAVDPASLLSRREDFDSKSLPVEILAITAGIDTQDDRLEWHILGHGLGNEVWSIAYGTIPHTPDSVECWREVDSLLARDFVRADGVKLQIRATAMDSGGHFTSEVATGCGKRRQKFLYAIKGQAGDKPLWPIRISKNKKTNEAIRVIGVDGAKYRIYRALTVSEKGPNYIHFPMHYDERYFSSLTAEKLKIQYQNGHPKRVWVKSGPNEVLDTFVYALAALESLKLNLIQLKSILDRQAEELKATGAIKKQNKNPWAQPNGLNNKSVQHGQVNNAWR
jgi:phage terminase large subunit GpA-like protein